MKFEETLGALMCGYKIKLPEWKGHWYMDNADREGPEPVDREYVKSHIKVFTKDGEILDTPHFDKYEAREDWEIVND